MPARNPGGRKLKEFLRKARTARKRSKGVDVGFFKTARYPDGTPVAAVAAWNEFGVPSQGIPERPFFRNAIEGADRVIGPILKAGIDPKDMALDDRTAGIIGEVMKARIQQSIVTLKEPPNAPITVKGGWMRNKKTGKLFHVKGKSSDNPLIDIGTLHGAVDYAVTDPGDAD